MIDVQIVRNIIFVLLVFNPPYFMHLYRLRQP